MNLTGKTSKSILLLIKLIITALILWFITEKINFFTLFDNLKEISFLSFAIIILTTLIKLFIQYNNWTKYLYLNPEYHPLKHEMLKSFFIGMSFHFLLPAGLGVFGKVFFVNNTKSATTVSVGVERIFITWKNIFFAAFASIFYFTSVSLFLKVSVFIFILISPFLLYLFSYFFKRKKIKDYFNNYLKIVPRIIVMQIIFTLISFFQYFIILNNFLKINLWKIFISVPLIHISHILPISFSGFGVREIFAINIFSRWNISPEEAVSTTLIIFFVNTVLPAFVGLIILFKKRNFYTK
ncbi:MAG: lysylphosphatidylglycerol synthase domain-containing protein [Candidatus Cloacimonadota bacterium]|nr:lysylphosphatidylglycerol synthase domain-containing protein [Candidatus Cloacimonadota bacterium]